MSVLERLSALCIVHRASCGIDARLLFTTMACCRSFSFA
ncbi:hypothetical protein BURPS305_1288 [Burkholderia pseudomallei 305]|nr:hypothetical protein BURPS305_1288 [Burkholderia pseudomallei 305]